MIGNEIQKLRKLHNLTQAELASKLNVSTSTIGMYESDNREPRIAIILKLSELFSVSTDYLLGSHTTEKILLNKSDFGSRLKVLRDSKNLTQADLADLLDVDRTSISKYENNKQEPELHIIRKISTLFNVSIDFLLGNSIDENIICADNSIEETLKEHFSQASNEEREKIFMLVSKLYWQYKEI